jgi:hypothetical protein
VVCRAPKAAWVRLCFSHVGELRPEQSGHVVLPSPPSPSVPQLELPQQTSSHYKVFGLPGAGGLGPGRQSDLC